MMDRRQMLDRIALAIQMRGERRAEVERLWERDLDAIEACIDPDAVNDRWMLERFRERPVPLTTAIIRGYETGLGRAVFDWLVHEVQQRDKPPPDETGRTAGGPVSPGELVSEPGPEHLRIDPEGRGYVRKPYEMDP